MTGATRTALDPARAGCPPAAGSPPPAGPVILVIAAATAVGLALRLWQLSRPGYLLGVTEYDDGPTSAVPCAGARRAAVPRLILVQPPGITLLMVPAALAGRWRARPAGWPPGRILTALASAAGIVLAGLLVRHRGAVAALVACGVLAVYPDSVAAAHTVLVEPWLVLFCLAGAVAVMDRDRMASGGGWPWAARRSGSLERSSRGPSFPSLSCSGSASAASAAGWRGGPRPSRAGSPPGSRCRCCRSPPRAPALLRQPDRGPGGTAGRVSRVPVFARLQEMAGLSYAHFPLRFGPERGPAGPHRHRAHRGGPGAARLLRADRGGTGRGATPAPLDWFAVLTLALVAAIFLWPSQFHYHFCAFLAPFLGLAIALPVSTLAAA